MREERGMKNISEKYDHKLKIWIERHEFYTSKAQRTQVV